MNRINVPHFRLIAFLLFVLTATSVSAITYTNVQDYGAVGNGTTDDTSSIQSALNTGNPIYFPKTSAYYKVSSGLTYYGHRIVSNGATIRATDINFYLLTISYSDGVYIGDLNLEYPVEQTLAGGSVDPLRLIYCSNFIVERIIAKNGGSICPYYSNNGIIRDCQVINSAYMTFYIRICQNILVENCYGEKNVSSYMCDDSSNIKLINNHGEDSHKNAMRIEDCENVLVENNILKNSQTGLIAYGPRTGVQYDTDNIEFKGNTLYNCYKTLTWDLDEPYTNGPCEFALGTKMNVDHVLFDNNIVIGGDESTLLTDLSSNVVFNTAIGLDGPGVQNLESTPYYYFTLTSDVNHAYIPKCDGQMPVNWLFYVNFPSGVNISQERVMTMDVYWGGGSPMEEDAMAVKLYSGENRTGLICQISLYNPYKYITLPCILRIPDGVNVSSVKCIEVAKIGGTGAVNTITVSQICKGLKANVGYFHSYFASDVLNAVLNSNVFVGFNMPYVSRARVLAPAPTINTGYGTTGTTAQRPASPALGWHYYDTDLGYPVYWDGSDWKDINTYWLGNKVSAAIYFNGSNYVTLGKDARVSTSHYTIEGWIKPATSGTNYRYIVDRSNFYSPAYGYLLQLWSDNTICGYQSVAGNFFTAMVQYPFPHDNEFHHVAITFSYDGTTSTLKLYIDGELMDTGSAAGAPDYPPQSAEITCGNGFAGTIGEINFYTRTLSSDEIQKCNKKFKERRYAYWRFNEDTGTEAYDSSPYGTAGTTSNNVGTLINMNPATCRVDGKAGSGLSFASGISDYVDLGNPSWLNMTNYTITGWVKATTSGVTDRHIISRCNYNGTPYGYLLQLWSDNKLYGYQSVNGNFYTIMVSAAFPNDNAFHHVAMTFAYNGTTSTLKLYIDGELVQTGSATGAPDAPPTGAVLKCGEGFEGVLDEIKFYTKTLNGGEIEKEYRKDGNW